jgi:hypothetical protein
MRLAFDLFQVARGRRPKLVEPQLVRPAPGAVRQAQLQRVAAAVGGNDCQWRGRPLFSGDGHQECGGPVRCAQGDGKVELRVQLEPRALIGLEREHQGLLLARFHRPVPQLARSQRRLGIEQNRSAKGHEHRDTQHPHHRTSVRQA